MQPTRTLQDVISSLQSVYQPQIDLVRQQQTALPQQAQAQSDALGAKKDQAFGDILNGARRRGLGFSGIPLGDQAKYLSTDYAPALANLQTASTNQATSLEQAILGIQQQQNTQGQSIYQAEQDRAEQARQFDAQQRAAAAQSAAFGNLFNPQAPQQPQTPQAPDVYAGINRDNAIKSVHDLLNTGNAALVHSTINAITQSAAKGNLYDKYKLELLKAATQSNNNAAFNPVYAKLLQSAANYKAPAPKPSVATSAKNFVTKPGSGNLSTGNLMNNLDNWFGWLK
jgi:hypothetical protein